MILTKAEMIIYEKEKKRIYRIQELETIAKNKYCDYIKWDEIINMLSEDDKKEYYTLVKKTGF